MKLAFTAIAVLISISSFSQKHKCKPGFTYIPNMSSSSYRIIGDCYPDSIAKIIWRKYWKNVCDETSVSFWSDSLRYSNIHEWNDSIGCISNEKWYMRKGDHWINITKQEYDTYIKNKIK